MIRIFRIAFLAGLLTVALMVLPPTVQTTLAAECQCASTPTPTEQTSCTACVTACEPSGGMSRYGTVAGTACRDADNADPASVAATAPVPVTPATPPSTPAADVEYCTSESALDQVKCQLMLFIAQILNIIASFLGRVLVFMVDILITFAAYNGFQDAIVVQRGWVVVRDVVNMFFIVILLVSAFATIIGYDENSFHYKRVLPKLLLMAVLINFSRTIIQLGVDFSQVVMLTFVNAFASAGPGNLVSTLHLNQVLSMAPPSGSLTIATSVAGTDATGTIDPVNIILALMLGIFLLSISLGVIVIMTGYLIFRIVGLWIALILSPLALFATALPGRLQKSMDAFTGKYWTRLSALLTGGPIMAFFLWLTFAITQSATADGGGLAQAVDLNTSSAAATFLTSVGNSQDIASFIVGITLMLMGLDAAVSAASAVSETLGTYAKKVSGASQALGRLAATAPFLGAYYGGRAIDRRLDISGKAATAALGLAAPIPILRSLVRKPLISAMGRNKKLDQAEQKEYMEGLEGLSTKQKGIAAAATPGSFLATKGQRGAYVQQMMDRAGEKNSKAIKDEVLRSYQVKMARDGKLDDFKKNEKNKAKTDIAASTLTGPALDKFKNDRNREADSNIAGEEARLKNLASQYADRDVGQRQAFFLDKAKAYAESNGDKETVRNIEDQLKKNPHLALGGEKAKLARKIIADPEAMKGLSPQAAGDMGVHYALLEAAGALELDDKGKITGFDRAKADNVLSKAPKELRENMEQSMRLARDSSGKYGKKEFEDRVVGKNHEGTKIISNLPVMDAGKINQVGAELDRAISVRPQGPEATLGTGGAATAQPVMSDRAIAVEAAYMADPTNVTHIEDMIDQVSAKKAFANTRSFGAIQTASAADVGSLRGWSETAAAGTAGHRSRADVDTNLSKFESLASKIGKMSTTQRGSFAANMSRAGIAQTIITAKRAGLADDAQRSAIIKNFGSELVKMETDRNRSGRPLVAGTDEAAAQAALDEIRAELQKVVNKKASSAWGKTFEPEEV